LELTAELENEIWLLYSFTATESCGDMKKDFPISSQIWERLNKESAEFAATKRAERPLTT